MPPCSSKNKWIVSLPESFDTNAQVLVSEVFLLLIWLFPPVAEFLKIAADKSGTRVKRIPAAGIAAARVRHGENRAAGIPPVMRFWQMFCRRGETLKLGCFSDSLTRTIKKVNL